jgi:hypothetical protein
VQEHPPTTIRGSNGSPHLKTGAWLPLLLLSKEEEMTVVITAAIAFVAILIAERLHLF